MPPSSDLRTGLGISSFHRTFEALRSGGHKADDPKTIGDDGAQEHIVTDEPPRSVEKRRCQCCPHPCKTFRVYYVMSLLV